MKSAAVRIALALLGGLVPVSTATAQSPDLVVDGNRLAQSIQFQRRHFRSSDCAVVEGCARAGQRDLLRFDTATPNVGSGDLVLGSPAGNPLFQYSGCHGHYHFGGYALYELINSAGTRVRAGRKQAFCLLDSAPYSPAAGPSHGYTCSYQGITAGWQDIYGRALDCQWLDITGVPAGRYTLRITVNPSRQLTESNFTNNSVSLVVQVPSRIR
jgi:hypothetical protein